MAKGGMKNFLKTIIELIIGVMFIPAAAYQVNYVMTDPNLSGFVGVALLIGVVMLVIAGGIVYHAVTQFF